MRLRTKLVARNIVEKSDGSPSPFIGLESIEGGVGRLGVSELPMKQAEDSLRHRQDDVLFSKLRPYLAKSILARESGTGTGELLVLRPNMQIESRYLFYNTLSRPWLEWAEMTSYGSKMPRTSWEAVGEFPLWLPPLDEQRRIADFLDAETARIEQLAERRAQSLALLEERWKAFLRQAVSGDEPSAMASRVPWLRSHPASWGAAPLRYIAKIQRGASPRPIDDPKYFDESGTHAWVRISDVTASDMYLMETTQRLSDLGRRFSVPLRPGELFVSIAATVGKPIITKIECCIHDGFVAIREPKVHPEFLYYILLLGDAFRGLGKLGTQLNLNSETIGSIVVPIPSRVEQNEILRRVTAARIENASAQKAIRRQLELLAERRQALITTAVSGQFDVTTARGANLS